MKRTRAQRQQEEAEAGAEGEEPLYVDPVTMAPPTRPLVLTLCGHPVDQSYLQTLQTRAREQKQQAGYCCLVCDQVSAAAVRNFGLETALGLDNVEGPARHVPASHDNFPAALAEVPSFQPLMRELDNAIANARDRPLRRYAEVSTLVLKKYIIPLVRNGGETQREGYVKFLGDESDVFPTLEALFEWMDFGEGRYRREWQASHGIRIEVELLLRDKLVPLDANGRSTFLGCTREQFNAAPGKERGISFVYELV
jgi:hypothetical protein